MPGSERENPLKTLVNKVIGITNKFKIVGKVRAAPSESIFEFQSFMGSLVRCTLFTNKAGSRSVSDTSADRVRHSPPTYPSLFRQLLMLDETPPSGRLAGTSWC